MELGGATHGPWEVQRIAGLCDTRSMRKQKFVQSFVQYKGARRGEPQMEAYLFSKASILSAIIASRSFDTIAFSLST